MQAKQLHNETTPEDNFFERVYDIVRLIPEGRVTSYGAIARYLGAARSARMVGWAMNNSFSQPDLPAHRVVNRQGLLTGRANFTTPTLMQELLESEGIVIEDHKVRDFKQLFWDPALELDQNS